MWLLKLLLPAYFTWKYFSYLYSCWVLKNTIADSEDQGDSNSDALKQGLSDYRPITKPNTSRNSEMSENYVLQVMT